MDEYDRLLSRGRARWHAKLSKGVSLWRFANWIREATEIHHVGGQEFSELTMASPISMHRELTRRQSQEHPPVEWGAEHNPTECEGRVRLDFADILECLVDYLRESGEQFIEVGQNGKIGAAPEPIAECFAKLFCIVGELLIAAANRRQFRM